MASPALAWGPWRCKRAMLWMLIRIVVVHRSGRPPESCVPLPRPCPLHHSGMTTAITPPPSSPMTAGKSHRFVPLNGKFVAEPVDDIFPPDLNRPESLDRVLSAESAGSATASTKESIATPTSTTMPLSPSSPGTRTPRAKKAALEPDVEIHPGDGKTSELVSDMDGLNVRSPMHMANGLPGGIQQVMNGNTKRQTPTHDRSISSSTDSSSTSGHPHPVPPPHLGSSYGSEGFPVATSTDNDQDMVVATPADLQMSAQAALAVAAADEAIKQLNGTATVFQGPSTTGLAQVEHQYQLPRRYANFVKPQARSDLRSPDLSAHRQSSTSSSTTEASTSSEESDLCIPSIEWVNLPNAVSPSSAQGFFPTSPYLANTVLQQPQKVGRSPGRMPPPPLTGRGVNSPRRSQGPSVANDGQSMAPSQTPLSLDATAHTPGGLRSSALPGGVAPDAAAEEDDDDATVGNGRDRSPSTSSQSAQSGLDLLWRAATHPHQEVPNVNSPYDHPHDSKGKRKAGAEAVAQWRTSGIPTGDNGEAEGAKNGSPSRIMPPPGAPPKKRRRSEIQMEAIDPALRDEESGFGDESAMGVDNASDYPSESEEPGSGDDSEYQGGQGGQGGRPRGRGAGRHKGAAVKKAGRAGGRASTGTMAVNGTSGSSKGGSGKKARKTESPSGRGGGGGGSGSRRVSGGAASGPIGGVQCEYVNPLPVSTSSSSSNVPSLMFHSHTTAAKTCSRASTTSLDTWRDMLDVRASWYLKASCPRKRRCYGRRSRISPRSHVLNAEKALRGELICAIHLLIRSADCRFRMDALKRHQAKQHHH